MDITSDAGVHQGDPLAGLLFALAFHPVLLAIRERVPDLPLNVAFYDDLTAAGSKEQLRVVVDTMLELGPPRGLLLSTRQTVPAGAKPKTTIWSRAAEVEDYVDPLQRGISRLQEQGVTLLGVPLGHHRFVAAALEEKRIKVTEVTTLLPHLKDPHVEFCLLRSCLSLAKVMYLLRAVDTTDHLDALKEFDDITREGLGRILGVGIPEQQWQQAKLPVTLGGMGLPAAQDHAAAAFAASFLSSQPMVRDMLDTPENQPDAALPPAILTTLTATMGEEEVVTQEAITGLTQKQLSTKVSRTNQRLLLTQIKEDADEREVARLASVSLPHAGAWLNCTPLPALGLHLRPEEFATAAKFRLGLPMFSSAGPCPACLAPSDIMGDHALCCGTGGDKIFRHNQMRNGISNTAVEASLAPTREGNTLLPGTALGPTDILITVWAGGRNAALHVTVTLPVQDATRAGASNTPGHAMVIALESKGRRGALQEGEHCHHPHRGGVPGRPPPCGGGAAEEAGEGPVPPHQAAGGRGYCPPHLKDLPDPHEGAGLPSA